MTSHGARAFWNGEVDTLVFTLFLASKSMQEGWGSGGDDMSLGPGQWEDEEGGMWSNAASQESTSSCSSWGNAPKKGLQKVRGARTPRRRAADTCAV